MTEFKIKCEYKRKEWQKFFNDKEPQEYHRFSVVDSEEKVIPDEYLHFTKKDRGVCYCCWILISNNLLKRANINLGEPPQGKEYKFIINLGGEKVAKFNTNNSNKMVLKTKEYFQNTVQKIGFWDSENYFYELSKKKQNPTNKPTNSVQSKNKTDWIKIILICLPIIIFTLFFLFLVKWISKKKKL